MDLQKRKRQFDFVQEPIAKTYERQGWLYINKARKRIDYNIESLKTNSRGGVDVSLSLPANSFGTFSNILLQNNFHFGEKFFA